MIDKSYFTWYIKQAVAKNSRYDLKINKKVVDKSISKCYHLEVVAENDR